MTNKEFELEVLSYSGKYPSYQLKKLITYYIEKKHFSTIKCFTLSRRLATWFNPKREKKFKEKNKGKSEQQKVLDILKANLGKVNPLK